MILRKPYALLIKYFKIIHILMFIFFGYIVFALRKIYVFFSAYAKNSNFTYIENMENQYFSAILFIFVLLLLIFGISIYLLMRRKDKPVLFYKLVIGFSVILLIAFLYYLSFFKSLSDTVPSPIQIVILRDIMLFLYLINYFFLAVSFIRGFGFDIKKFSFEKDKKELKFEESDNEEYELNVGFDKDDIASYLNKQKREFMYYVKENSTIFTIAGIVLGVGLLIYLYVYFFVTNRVYSEKQKVNLGGIVFTVNDSHYDSLNKYGRVIDKNYDFLIVNMTIASDNIEGYLDKQGIRAYIDGEYYYPSKANCDLFDDLGKCYDNQQLKPKTSNNYIIVFKVNKTHSKAYVELLKSKKGGYNYTKVSISPSNYTKKTTNLNIGDSFTIGNDSYIVKSYQIGNKASYQYQECNDTKCNNFTKIVHPKTGEVILTLEIDGLEKLDDNLINSYFGLKYEDKAIYGNDIKLMARYENKVYLSVSSVIQNKPDLALTVNMRSGDYYISLSGGNSE